MNIYGMFIGGKSRIKEPSHRRIELDAFLPKYAFRLKRKRVAVRKLFEEYRCDYPGGYRHANFDILLWRYML